VKTSCPPAENINENPAHKFNITAFTVLSKYNDFSNRESRRALLPVGVSVIGGERHSMWNPLSQASQNKRLSCNQPFKSLNLSHPEH